VLADTLYLFGYKPEDDSWDVDGRRTYLNDENADKTFMRVLAGALSRMGWNKHPTILRAFQHWHSHEIIEIEVGGPDTSGHYLHHMKPETVT